MTGLARLALAVGLALVALAPATAGAPVPARIVSLVPAVTEMLFAIGAGEQVVGVSSFDRHPPEVRSRPRVGALIDPDLERILSLRPDMVITYGSQDDLQRQLTRASIPFYSYRHGGFDQITTALREIGPRVGKAAEAHRLAADLEHALADVRARVAGRPRPRVLLVFGREAGTLRNIYASGGDGFLHDMLVAAGGTNVFGDVRRESVQTTTELILARRPDVILEVRATALGGELGTKPDPAWQALSSVPAVRDRRVLVLVGDRFVVPGPRMAGATRDMAQALHPEAFR